MTRTLQDLITTNDFKGYPRTKADCRFETNQIEEAIYGIDGNTSLPYDLVDTFAERFDVEIFAINTWICTDTNVGLEVMRMQGLPVALIWQSARKSETNIAFLDKAALEKVREAWESVKPACEADASFASMDTLNMPLAAGEAETYDIETGAHGLPVLSTYGIATWIKAEGGLDKITNKAALTHALKAVQISIAQEEAVLARLKDVPPEIAIRNSLEKEVEKFNEYRDNLIRLRQDIESRISDLA
jgi:hypothetical protein